MLLNNLNGFNTFIGTDIKLDKKIFITSDDRLKHTLILGPDGFGKFYQTIVPFINSDIENNLGVIILDKKCELAEYVAAKAEHSKRSFIYFNPVFKECPKFNPIYGEENLVIESLSKAFTQSLSHLPKQLIKFNLAILSRAIKVVKRAYKDDANILDLYNVLYNTKDQGVKILHDLMDLKDIDEVTLKENTFICEWFINFYKGGIIEGVDVKKNSIAVRQEIWNLLNNELLSNCLITDRGVKPDIIIEDVLQNQNILCMATNEGHLGKLSDVLTNIFMFQLKGYIKKIEDKKNVTMLYINHAQHVLNKEISNIIPLCSKKSIGLVLVAQSPLEYEKIAGIRLCQFIFRNCSIKIIYPYANDSDYGLLYEKLNEREIFMARCKVRYAHYIIQSSISNNSGVMAVDLPNFNDEYEEIDKLRIKHILNNTLLTS